jgi:protein-tyrosine phosphatase
MRLEIYTFAVENIGKISLMPRPRGGDWLEDEILALRQNQVEVLVSLLTRQEELELDLSEEKSLCEEHGIAFYSFPIEDRKTPLFSQTTFDFLAILAKTVQAGKHLAVHCRMGIGRSALVVGCILVQNGYTIEQALAMLTQVRGKELPDTEEQIVWMRRFAETLDPSNTL